MNPPEAGSAEAGKSSLDWRPEYSGKVVCVVGGTSGMGQAVALALRTCGARVFITGSTPASASRAQEKPEPAGTAQVDILDVRNSEAVLMYAARFGALHLLVNAVGTSFPFEEMTPGRMADAIDVNLTGVARVCAAMHPALKAGRGSVVNFASMTSFFGSASNPIYSASKGGIVQLTKSLALLWSEDAIRVNAIAPGYIRTRLTERRWANAASERAIVERTPLRRWGDPTDVVGPVLFLGSSAAAFITGSTLPVDGGYLAG